MWYFKCDLKRGPSHIQRAHSVDDLGGLLTSAALQNRGHFVWGVLVLRAQATEEVVDSDPTEHS